MSECRTINSMFGVGVSLTAGLSAIPSKGITIVRETNGGQLLTMGKNRHRK